MRRVAAGLLALAVVVASSMPPVTAAQEAPAPPELGATILEDPLAQSGVLRPSFCSTGRNAAQYVADGFQLKVTGRCAEASTTAYLVTGTAAIRLPDGEIRVALEPLDGAGRARFYLWGRTQTPEQGGGGYAFVWEPGGGTVALLKSQDEQVVALIQRTDLGSRFGSDQPWTMALRFEGERIWALLDDEVVLTATDSRFDAGGAGVGLQRLGPPDDAEAATAIVRDLQVAALSETDRARVPTHEPTTAQPPGSSGFVPAAGTPPASGPLVVEDPLTEPGMVPVGRCATGRGAAGHVDEGLLFTVSGACTDAATIAAGQSQIPGLRIPDGELRLDMKVTGGGDRTDVIMYARLDASAGDVNGYFFLMRPASGVAAIGKVVDGTGSTLVSRTDLGGRISADDWNTVAIRMSGERLWMLINDLPVLSADDPTFSTGNVVLRVYRRGELDDDLEAAVVFRNLSVSEIEGTEADRAPTYPQSRPPANLG